MERERKINCNRFLLYFTRFITGDLHVSKCITFNTSLVTLFSALLLFFFFLCLPVSQCFTAGLKASFIFVIGPVEWIKRCYLLCSVENSHSRTISSSFFLQSDERTHTHVRGKSSGKSNSSRQIVALPVLFFLFATVIHVLKKKKREKERDEHT